MKKLALVSMIFVALVLCISCTDQEPTDLISYPESGLYGVNLLDLNLTQYQASTVSLSAILGEDASLRVKIVGESWRFTNSSVAQWSTGGFNDVDNSRIFTSVAQGKLDGRFEIYPGTSLEIFVYENGADGPTWSKSITVN